MPPITPRSEALHKELSAGASRVVSTARSSRRRHPGVDAHEKHEASFDSDSSLSTVGIYLPVDRRHDREAYDPEPSCLSRLLSTVGICLPGDKQHGYDSYDAEPSHKFSRSSLLRWGGALLLLVIVVASQLKQHCVHPAAASLAVPGTAYRGPTWHSERTVAVDTVGETAYARCDVHTVVSEDGTSFINDWLFLEEVPAVNVVVQTLEGRFALFRQRKYAIPGDTLAPVGGLIDAHESPLAAAQRELLEELGLGSRQTSRAVRQHARRHKLGNDPDVATVAELIARDGDPPRKDVHGLLDGRPVPPAPAAPDVDADWVFLGRYRTAANRGGGFLYSYLLKNAVPLVPRGGTAEYRGTGDGEAQEILYLEESEVRRALSEGLFQEVKWTATFSLAMLHLQEGGK